jgi:hypothetical protein
MIKSLSPYYLTIPFVSPLTSVVCTEYTLQIFVWDGVKATPPSEPSYEITKQNIATSSGNDKINIAMLVNDYIDFTPESVTFLDLYNANNQVWIKTQVIYTTTDEDDLNVVQLESTNLMLQGYGYGLDGENSQPPTNKILLSGTEFKVSRSGYFSLPIMLPEATIDEVTIKSYPNNQIDETLETRSTTTSGEMVQIVWIDVSDATTDETIEIVYNGETITLLITDECRYTPLDIAFQNKEGAMQIMTFFKAKTESMSVTSETFESDRGQPIDGNHQMVTYNVQANSKFRMNSGFIDESMNETFKQLFLSERVWQFDGTNYIPLKLGSKSLEYKTRMKDRLINYEVEFEYAFNDINNV